MQFRYYYKPCGKKSNGLDRSITNARYFSPASGVFFRFFYHCYYTVLWIGSIPKVSSIVRENIFKKWGNLFIQFISKDFK